MIIPRRMALIYLLHNVVNGKEYVGQTTLLLQERWKNHVRSVKYGSTTHLHRAIKLHGHDAFNMIVLEHCDVKDLNRLEIAWIDKLGTFGDRGYNETRGGDGVKGYKHTEADVQRNRETHTGKVYSQATCELKSRSMMNSPNVQRIRVIQFSLTGDKVREFASVSEAARFIEHPNGATLISRCCRGKTKTALGFKWQYVSDVAQSKPRNNNIGRAVEQLTQNDELIATHTSIAKANRAIGRPMSSSIKACCNGLYGRKTAYGFKWKFVG